MDDYDHNGFVERVKQRLTDLDLSPRKASLMAGSNQDLIRGLLRGGNRTVRGDHLVGLARALKVTESWLITGKDAAETETPEGSFGVRFGGVVEAGAFRPQNELNQDGEYRPTPVSPDPRFPRASQYAFTVMGDSMTRERIYEGMYVLAVDIHTYERLHGSPGDGKLVVVARLRDSLPERELTVKKLRLFRDRMELQPCSDNPAYEPLVFPLPLQQSEETEVLIIAVVISAVWSYS